MTGFPVEDTDLNTYPLLPDFYALLSTTVIILYLSYCMKFISQKSFSCHVYY